MSILIRIPNARVVAIAILVGALVMSIRLTSMQASTLHDLIGTTTKLEAVVRTDPVATAPRVSGRNFAARTFTFLAHTDNGPIRVIASRHSVVALLPGQHILITGRLIATDEYRVVAMVIASQKIRVLTKSSRWAITLAHIRTGLRNATGGGDAGALIPGMVIGDTAKQSQDFKSDMRRAGLTHLVAVSGANFAIVTSFVLWLMQFCFRSYRPRLIATALALAAFIALVRPTPSVLRAAAMAAVMLIAHASFRKADSLPALGFAIAAVVMIDPWQARDAGFALSVLATAGLLLVAPRLPIHSALAVPIAAMTLCLPIIISLSGFISPMSIVANIIAAPFVAPITVVGFIAALIAPLSHSLAVALITCIKPFATIICAIARWSAHFPVLTIGNGARGFCAALVLILLILLFRLKAVVALALVILIALNFARFPTHDWDYFSCDVGQGDATVINLHHHTAIVIDTGPDAALMDKCLRILGVSHIALLILTHGHADHIGGLQGALKGRRVDHQWFGNVSAGTTATIGAYTLTVVWPLPGKPFDENPNNDSIAMVIESKDVRIFAAGDIEPPVQEKLRGRIGHVDIYKVAHHGSRYQDLQLMRELTPSVATIEVGKGNSYGHPADSTISTLRALGTKIFRTDRDGAVAIRADDHRLNVEYDNAHLHLLGLG